MARQCHALGLKRGARCFDVLMEKDGRYEGAAEQHHEAHDQKPRMRVGGNKICIMSIAVNKWRELTIGLLVSFSAASSVESDAAPVAKQQAPLVPH